MDKLLKSFLFAAASVLGTAGVASASLILESWNEANPGALVAGTIPGGSSSNEVLEALGSSTLEGYYGSQIRLSSNARIRYTFIGFEAGFANRFSAGGGVFDTEAFGSNAVIDTSGLASFTQDASAGLLAFSFLTDGGANGIINGNENTNNVGSGGLRNPDFFASIVGDPTALSGNSLYLFLDDLGAGPDDDHDDMAIRIDVLPVPVPAAGLLLVTTALLGMGLARRRV